MAGFVGRVHRGPRRDQLLDHGGVAFRSRKMQRRLASGAEDATRKAGQLQLPSRNKAIVMGCSPGGTNELRPEEICLYKNGPELIAPGPGLLK